MTKVLLVYPRYGWIDDDHHPAAPLGIAYLAAALIEQGIQTEIHDMTWDKNLDVFRNHMLSYEPDVVGIQVLSHNVVYVNDLIPRIRCLLPKAKIVLGGPHVTCVSDACDDGCMIHVDCIIKGEAEITLPKLILSNNLCGVHQGEPPDLDKLPVPARELLPMDKYLSIPFIEPLPYPTTNIMTSRGCFFKCHFCSPLSEKMFCNVRFRSPNLVVDEIEWLVHNYGIKGLDIEDDLFVFSPELLRQFHDEMISRGINLKWRANSRVDTITAEKAKLLAECGCIELIFGVESGSQKMLDAMNKHITTDQIRKAILMCQEQGIITMTNYVIGYPGETKATLKETSDMIDKLKSDIVDINIANPMPGTWLYDYCVKNELMNVTDSRNFSRTYAGGIRLEHLTAKELDAARDAMYKQYYKYLFKNLRKPFIRAMVYRTQTLMSKPIYLMQLMTNYVMALVLGKERKQVK